MAFYLFCVLGRCGWLAVNELFLLYFTAGTKLLRSVNGITVHHSLRSKQNVEIVDIIVTDNSKLHA